MGMNKTTKARRSIRLVVPDEPGALAEVTSILAGEGIDIVRLEVWPGSTASPPSSDGFILWNRSVGAGPLSECSVVVGARVVIPGGLHMQVPAGNRGMGGIVEVDMAGILAHVESVCLREVLGCEHMVSRTLRHHPTSKQDHMIGPTGILEVVCSDHDGPARCPLDPDRLLDHPRRDHVKGRRRLVEQQHISVLYETLGDEHPLALPSGELADMSTR